MLGFSRTKKRDLFATLYAPGSAPGPRKAEPAGPPVVTVANMPGARIGYHDGEKFPGGFGPTEWPLITDYWTLRARSAQLFKGNLYARGLIRRLVRNEINTGLHLESTPEERTLGFEKDSLADWTEEVETRFGIWAKEPKLCDHTEQASFGDIQSQVRFEALIDGDVLVVLKQDQRTRLPRVQLIPGGAVQTPLEKSFANPGSNRVVHGVELDSANRHVAYWVRQHDGTSKRIATVGEKSHRRIAWLVYGTEKRVEEVRGEPLLSVFLQSLRELDRYRDAALRKAVINSYIALVVTKDQDKMGTRPLSGGAMRRGVDKTIDAEGKERSYRFTEIMPGFVIEELQTGEDIKPIPPTGTDEKFRDFEEAIVAAICWAMELPPEIGKLSFSSNYSASQAAINEFKMYLEAVRTFFGQRFCQPIYIEWLIASATTGRVSARGFIDAWRNPAEHEIAAAWWCSSWSGHIKPAVDMNKLVPAYEKLIGLGAITYDRASRELTGTKFSKNVQRLALESQQLADARRPMVELEQSAKSPPPPNDGGQEERGKDDEEDDGGQEEREDDEEQDDAAARVLPMKRA